jgi:hypothetical protein
MADSEKAEMPSIKKQTPHPAIPKAPSPLIVRMDSQGARSRAYARNCFGDSGLNHVQPQGVRPCAFRHIGTKVAPDTST